MPSYEHHWHGLPRTCEDVQRGSGRLTAGFALHIGTTTLISAAPQPDPEGAAMKALVRRTA